MYLFKKLSVQENEALLKFPVYVAMLAANTDSRLDEDEKESVIKLSHMKTYTCDPLLLKFFKQADEVFEKNIGQLETSLPKEKAGREAAIKNELLKLEKIISKLGKNYKSKMHLSMKSFKDHVSKAHHNVLVDFILPLPISGLTE